MKGQDIVVLLKLVSLEQDEQHGLRRPRGDIRHEDPFSVRGLEASLGISKSEVNASIMRSIASGLAIKDRISGRPRPNRRHLRKFIVYGLKFVFPAGPGAMIRGVPTAFAAPSLKKLLMSAGEYIYVWPFARGKDMGQSVEPLFKSVPDAALKDDRLYEYLALIDAIRLGNQREIWLAAEQISERLVER